MEEQNINTPNTILNNLKMKDLEKKIKEIAPLITKIKEEKSKNS